MAKLLNWTLYIREMKRSLLILVIFSAVLLMYVSTIISMYGSDISEMMSAFGESIEEMMGIMGISFGGEPTLVEFLVSFLYGFIVVLFPMVFVIMCANKLIAQYVERGSMVSLIAAPVKRSTVAFTQMKVLGTNILLLVLFITLLQIAVSAAAFPGELEIPKLLLLNLGLLCLLLFIGGICFFCSCLFSDAKYSLGFGAGIPAVSFILQMLGNAGEQVEAAKYLSFFTLFDANKIIAGETFGIAGMFILFGGAVALYFTAVAVFSKKDLHI